MMRNVLLFWAVLLGTPWPALGDLITVAIPSLEIPYTATSASFTIPVQITGSYPLDNYSLLLKLVPRSGASGVTFSTSSDAAQKASTNYIFDAAVGWQTSLTDSMNIGGDDAVSGDRKPIANGTWNLITVKLNANLTADDIGDQYDVTFSATGSASRFQTWTGSALATVPSGQMSWNPGVITVVPEPSSQVILLLGLGAGALLFYRRLNKR